MTHFDKKISEAFVRTTGRSRLLIVLSSIGASHIIWLVLGMAYATSWYHAGADTGPEHVRALTIFLVFAWLFTLVFEYVFRRRRPFEHGPKPLIDMLLKTPSFPSGHATISFTIASAMYFIDATLFPWYMAAAVFVSFSRVAVGVHYLSDVVAGAVVGTLVPWGLRYLAFYVFM
jgi:undecaprenyl-diphosphatase